MQHSQFVIVECCPFWSEHLRRLIPNSRCTPVRHPVRQIAYSSPNTNSSISSSVYRIQRPYETGDPFAVLDRPVSVWNSWRHTRAECFSAGHALWKQNQWNQKKNFLSARDKCFTIFIMRPEERHITFDDIVIEFDFFRCRFIVILVLQKISGYDITSAGTTAFLILQLFLSTISAQIPNVTEKTFNPFG